MIDVLYASYFSLQMVRYFFSYPFAIHACHEHARIVTSIYNAFIYKKLALSLILKGLMLHTTVLPSATRRCVASIPCSLSASFLAVAFLPEGVQFRDLGSRQGNGRPESSGDRVNLRGVL